MSAQGMPMPPSVRAAASAPRPPAVPTLRPVPARRRGRRTVMVLGVMAMVAVTAASAAIAWKLTTPEASGKASSAPSASGPAGASAPTPASASGAAPPQTPPSAAPSARSSAPPPAPPTAPPAPPPKDTAACFAAMLPEQAFGRYEPKLDRLCTDTRAYQGMLEIKTAIVRAGGSYTITPAMAEWSKLGWFETAAYAAMRAHCCPDGKALKAGGSLGRCKMDEALAYVANAIDDEAKLEQALGAYREAARCIALAGGGYAWGRLDAPYGGEEVYFKRIYARMKQARGR